MARRLRIALLIGASRQYRRDLLRGIADYARVHGPWSFYHEEQIQGTSVPAWLKHWEGDGILARLETRHLVDEIRKKGLPTVDLLGRFDVEGIPAFDNDSVAVARLGAEHLLNRGFEHFAYCGLPGVHYSDSTGACFVEYLRKAGYSVSHFEGPSRHEVSGANAEHKAALHEDELARWLVTLPKPVGLMACNDLRAQQVLNACSKRDIAVPNDVAVLGADNDDVLCGLSNPPLSSIDPNARRIGRESAALLERMIAGEPPPRDKILIEPAGVVVRRSTDVLAIADRTVAAAVEYIRDHATEGLHVDDVLRRVRLSRSTLERRFAKYLGRSPKAEILRVQLQRVKQFLAETDYPLNKVARLSGFNHVENMCNLFRRRVGQTPGNYRKQLRADRGE
ncbi:MAG: DNA-binding transcriptional regulator [Pirellulales bacterium]|nr:DNA-binding transcriptional regulator [Pirellulales bacterium]